MADALTAPGRAVKQGLGAFWATMHLTYPDEKSNSNPVDPEGSAGAPEHEIEITPEMIEAGMNACMYMNEEPLAEWPERGDFSCAERVARLGQAEAALGSTTRMI